MMAFKGRGQYYDAFKRISGFFYIIQEILQQMIINIRLYIAPHSLQLTVAVWCYYHNRPITIIGNII